MAERIFFIDDDEEFVDCLAKNLERKFEKIKIKKFKNAIDAMNELVDPLPDLIFLDVLLPGPDGFTFLNEIVSYVDTARIPVVLMTNLSLEKFDLKKYGVVGILNKEKMKPEEVETYVKRY